MGNASFIQIQIPRRQACCLQAGEKFIPGMEYYSVLEEQDAQLFVRQDFCSACWEQSEKAKQLTESQSYWKAKVPSKKEEPASQPRLVRALSLLKELARESEEKQEEAFILAVYLAHARRLVLRQEIEREGVFYSLYEIPHTEEWITVKKINPFGLDIQKMKELLSQKLK